MLIRAGVYEAFGLDKISLPEDDNKLPPVCSYVNDKRIVKNSYPINLY